MVKLGLIGCGIWGRRILATLVKLGEEVAVVEPRPKRRAEIMAEYSVCCHESIEDLPEVDGFIVATPASTHASVVHKVLPFGIPIFVEKPLTTNSRDARKLAEAGSDLIFVMHIWQYHLGVEALANVAGGGELGAVNLLRTTRKNWTSPRQDVDSTWTMLPHDISIAKAVLGHIPQPHFAQAEIINGRVVGMLAVLGDRPPQVIIDISNRYEEKRRDIRLHCENGIACLPRDDCGYLSIARQGESEHDGIITERHEFVHHPPLEIELKRFAEYLAGGPPPPTDFKAGLEVVETVEALRRLAGLSF